MDLLERERVIKDLQFVNEPAEDATVRAEHSPGGVIHGAEVANCKPAGSDDRTARIRRSQVELGNLVRLAEVVTNFAVADGGIVCDGEEDPVVGAGCGVCGNPSGAAGRPAAAAGVRPLVNADAQRAGRKLHDIEAWPVAAGQGKGDAVAAGPYGEVARVEPAADCEGAERANGAIRAESSGKIHRACALADRNVAKVNRSGVRLRRILPDRNVGREHGKGVLLEKRSGSAKGSVIGCGGARAFLEADLDDRRQVGWRAGKRPVG
jgi:hypothetical protein